MLSNAWKEKVLVKHPVDHTGFSFTQTLKCSSLEWESSSPRKKSPAQNLLLNTTLAYTHYISHWLPTEFQGQTETWIQLETLSQNSVMQVKFDLEPLRCFRLVQNIQGTVSQGTARNAPAWCLGISISYGIFRHSKKASLWYLVTEEHSWHPPTVICSLDLVFADISQEHRIQIFPKGWKLALAVTQVTRAKAKQDGLHPSSRSTETHKREEPRVLAQCSLFYPEQL